MNAYEARQIANKAKDELKENAKKEIEFRVIPIINKAAAQGFYQVEIPFLNDIEAEVLRCGPYNYHVFGDKENYNTRYTVNWEDNPKFLTDI